MTASKPKTDTQKAKEPMDLTKKFFVAGHKGLVGGAIVRALEKAGAENLVKREKKALDLRDQAAVRDFFEEQRPDYVFLGAAKVGGILANDTYPADFISDNLLIQTHVIDAAYRSGVKKLLFLGSSCIYPKHCPQPMKEEHLLTGSLEPTNQWYAVAKIAGIKMCQAYRRQYGFNAICAMPTNLYGPGDNFDLKTSHVIPALIRKFYEARASGAQTVTVWGTGKVKREFLHVDDLAAACLFLMANYEGEQIVNVGAGSDITIAELALLIRRISGFSGEIVFDASKPDGIFQKLLDASRLSAMGWKPVIGFHDGLTRVYENYVQSRGGRRSTRR